MQASPRDYQDVPIDIQTGKLLDWLVDRRHCGLRWQAQVSAVRQKIEAALRDMPEHEEIARLLAGAAIHYSHCLRIVDILRGTEASTKNLFGRYSSQRMKGSNVHQELLALVQDLPSLLSEVGAGVGALSEAVELYQACVEFVCQSSEGPVVPMLRYVGSKGNTTVYEWRTGFEPVKVERPEVQVVPEQPKEDNGIDWGDGEGNGAQITVLEDGSEEPEAVARGSDALTLLENAATRNQFIDELMELELFLAQRLVEMEEEADVLAASQFQLAPAVLQGQTSTRVGTLLANTRALLDQLSTRRMQHLFIILASPRYVDRVSEMLQQKLNQAELLLAKREALSRKRHEALTEQGVLEPKLDRLQERTRELQQLIEADISKRYGGRPVHLMGVSL